MMGSSARAAAPPPAAGLRMTWAWIRSPNLVRFQVSLRKQQLRVENRRARSAADRVVAQHDEAMAQHGVPRDPPHRHAHPPPRVAVEAGLGAGGDRKSTHLKSSHRHNSYAVFFL